MKVQVIDICELCGMCGSDEKFRESKSRSTWSINCDCIYKIGWCKVRLW
ncbi:MAG: hypothetical protein HFJ50_02755 [Clostridia bacterium]|nr:hypothetical protein [Clostridia bacterium]